MGKQKSLANFENWRDIDLQEHFGINPVQQSEVLADWIKVSGEITPMWVPVIEFYRLELFRFSNHWNEMELFGNFIAPFMNTVNMKGKRFNTFHQRPLGATIQGIKVRGIVDGMVASGTYEPYHPYFFMNEYKRFKIGDSDPLGQLLIAMTVAQHLNPDSYPVYGCFVYSKLWQFVVLEGNTYAQSQAYDATDPDEIRTIWLILQKTKQMIAERVEQETKA